MKTGEKMSEEIVVSICCLSYNHENYIVDALEGFLTQKVNFKYEILIHDDASTDKTSEILMKYEQKYPDLIKVIYQKENQYSKGECVSKFLYEKSKGKYLALCEGDDYWIDKTKLQRQVDFLEKNSDYIATYHNVLVVDKNKNKLKEYQDMHPLYKEHDIVKENLNQIYLCGQTASLVCKNFWKNWSEKEKNIFCSKKAPGDGKLSLVLLLMGKVHFFREIMSCYRVVLDGNSWTAKSKNKNQALLQYDILMDLKRLADEMFKYDYNVDINSFITYSFKIFLKKLTYSDMKIFFYLLNQRKSYFDVIYYTLKKISGVREERNESYPPLIQSVEKDLKGSYYEN